MFEKIVVAVDGSEHAERALNMACDIATKYNSELHLVHSPQLETIAIAVGVSAVAIPPEDKNVEEAGKKILDMATASAKTNGCEPVKCTIGTGKPAEDILQTVAETGADLIVMGRRGLGSVPAVLLGSVSQKVSHASNCTCLTVH